MRWDVRLPVAENAAVNPEASRLKVASSPSVDRQLRTHGQRHQALDVLAFTVAPPHDEPRFRLGGRPLRLDRELPSFSRQ